MVPCCLGAPYHDTGQVRIYQYNPTGGGEGAGAWEQLGDDIDGEGFQDRA